MTTQVPQLTTTFTPDKSCFQYFKYRYTGTDRTCKEGGTGTPSACTYLQLGPSESDAGCFPSSLELGTSFYYSPGICPSGFEVACSSTLDDGETRATCCPSQFTCQSETRWPWYSTDLCTLVIPKTVDVIVSDSVLGGEWERKTSRGGGANAIGIPIRWHSSDFESTTTADTVATMTETGSSSTSASSSESESNNDGLSGGAKIGIGVGIGVGALLGIIALIWFVLRARRSKQASIEHTEPKTPQMQQQQAPWEMEQQQAPMELDTQADMRPVELPTEGATRDQYKK